MRGDRGRFRGTTSRGCGDRRCLRRYRANRGRFKDILYEARLDFPMSQHQCRDTTSKLHRNKKKILIAFYYCFNEANSILISNVISLKGKKDGLYREMLQI